MILRPGSLLTIMALILGVDLPSRAEYRVFLLKIERPAPTPPKDGSPAGADPNTEERVRFVQSNLDPEQYRQYHLIRADETITYVDTWRCRGRTDRKEYCANPRAPASVGDVPPGAEAAQGPESRAPGSAP